MCDVDRPVHAARISQLRKSPERIADPDHEEHESTLRWAGGQFDPEAFDPGAVKFDDPKKRWKKAFGR